jgi:SAM-dependent methyltransferase
MTFSDRVLQRWRIAKAARFIPRGARVLDIGSADGALFDRLGGKIGGGLGIDPTLRGPAKASNVPLVAGFFPKDMPAMETFDVITMLAVLEHFPAEEYAVVAEGCARFLKVGGRLIITVPSPAADHILKVLVRLRLVHGMSLGEHHGYEVEQTVRVFASPAFRLVWRRSFQLGLNNLFVFERV